MSWLVQEAQPNDAEDVGFILHDWNMRTQWMPKLHNLSDTIDFAGDMIARGWVNLIRDVEVLGFIARDGMMIHSLYVDRTCRGRRVGSTLVKNAQSQSNILTLWTFQDNVDAQRFYLRHGFAEASRSNGEHNDEHLPDIRYVWHRKGRAE